MQFVEKLLKACIRKGGEKPKRHHDLSQLASEATHHGCPEVPEYLIRNVQCPAGVRYGETGVTLTQAVGALHSAIKIGCIVAPRLVDEEPYTTPLR